MKKKMMNDARRRRRRTTTWYYQKSRKGNASQPRVKQDKTRFWIATEGYGYVASDFLHNSVCSSNFVGNLAPGLQSLINSLQERIAYRVEWKDVVQDSGDRSVVLELSFRTRTVGFISILAFRERKDAHSRDIDKSFRKEN